MKEYCTQNNGDCPTCSLVSYNRDCQNKPLHGGKRPGAGRPQTDRRQRNIMASDSEWDLIKKVADKVRSENTMTLKQTLDAYEQGKADTLDIGIALMNECGTGDHVEIKRAADIVKRT